MAYETVERLIQAFREDEKDDVQPYFWSDSQLVRWTNEALTEFAEESMSIYDDQSPFTFVSYGEGETRFEIDPCVIDVVDAWVDGHRHHRLRKGWPEGVDWRGGYGAFPVGFFSNFHFDPSGVLRLHPKPAEPGLLRLRVIRRPVREVAKCDPVPDLLPADRRYLLWYIAYKAYRVNEAETYSAASSAEHLQRFREACQTAREKAILRRGDCSRPIRSCW
ncbi:hypothetical protein [Pseudomonas typographi]|uniref:hypothetical protein n=1 Tax=Pseudomonas typographi TaxID=2715964 RepID=UPI001684DB73|nr:hypothetical protein [Pseudomonas typographi]MBD1554771.1 hypothetical protein [Pseudomonas typographi]